MKWQILTFFLMGFILANGPANAQDRAAEIQQSVEVAQRALSQNDLARAEQEYRAILRLDPNNADAYTALGVLLYGSGKLKEAVSSFQAALGLGIGQKRADLFLGLSQADLGECDKSYPYPDAVLP